MTTQSTIYELAGGEATFVALVDAFYEGIMSDEVLRPMYPPELTAAKRHLTLFLIQYFGGPTTYSDERGHPRLRMRHAPFIVNEDARDRWLTHMNAAISRVELPEDARVAMSNYFASTADFLINQQRKIKLAPASSD